MLSYGEPGCVLRLLVLLRLNLISQVSMDEIWYLARESHFSYRFLEEWWLPWNQTNHWSTLLLRSHREFAACEIEEVAHNVRNFGQVTTQRNFSFWFCDCVSSVWMFKLQNNCKRSSVHLPRTVAISSFASGIPRDALLYFPLCLSYDMVEKAFNY